MNDLFKFYGFDWLGMIATFTSLWLLGEKKPYGFIIGAIAAACWAVFSFLAGSWASLIANIVFFVLQIYNFWKWRRKSN